MADVEANLAGLSLEEDEEEPLIVEEVHTATIFPYEFCFVGSFLTTSVVNFQSMRSTLSNVWHPTGGISISDIGDGRFLFRLYHTIDAERIEAGGP
ncbi:hypothetical protein HRI_002300100 [Hibiscus trionum]|uniref:DUF4283 domain-containing protein n=1 Tax=Hibiscus trionum TaxID=183268 RepID=A0A9W7HZK6_HIBTR|nr:hypothetical protein HRI_002300100 [Hibiscus trionum]